MKRTQEQVQHSSSSSSKKAKIDRDDGQWENSNNENDKFDWDKYRIQVVLECGMYMLHDLATMVLDYFWVPPVHQFDIPFNLTRFYNMTSECELLHMNGKTSLRITDVWSDPHVTEIESIRYYLIVVPLQGPRLMCGDTCVDLLDSVAWKNIFKLAYAKSTDYITCSSNGSAIVILDCNRTVFVTRSPEPCVISVIPRIAVSKQHLAYDWNDQDKTGILLWIGNFGEIYCWFMSYGVIKEFTCKNNALLRTMIVSDSFACIQVSCAERAIYAYKYGADGKTQFIRIQIPPVV